MSHKSDSYRPVSLLSILDKVLEKLVFNQRYSFFLQNDIWYKYQFGFRTGFSTSLALIYLIPYIFLFCLYAACLFSAIVANKHAYNAS